MGRILAAALALLLAAAPAWAGDPPDPRAEGLRSHALRVRTTDPDDDDFGDLQGLKPLLEGVRIVQLGEETHGDGACFLAKTRLIRFLHEEMGFDVLAFESGLHGCEVAWTALKQKGRDPVDAMKQGIFGIWMQSHEVKPLARYLGHMAGSKTPLQLCGFDCQITSQASHEALLPDLERVLGAEGVADPRWAPGRAALEAMIQSDAPYDAKAQAALTAAMELVAPRAHGPDAAFWKQLARSLTAQGESRMRLVPGQPVTPEANNLRDAQMAKNLIWLAEERFPKRKIIVWAATFHLIRGAPKLKPLAAPIDYAKTRPMGEHVAEHFGKACYTVGFTAYGGEIGRPWSTPSSLATPAKGTFEALCVEAELENAIVDLRHAPADAAWLRERFVARPLGYAPMRGPWHEVLDALFFQRHMTPSTRAGYKVPDTSSGLVARIDKQWTAIQTAVSRGNPWAVKWTFSQALQEWRHAMRADAAAVEKEEASVRTWLAAHEEEPGAAWRAHGLLAEMAAARGDAKSAVRAYDAALAAYSKVDLPEPAKFSQFQHLANERAMRTWDVQGFDAALTWAMHLLATDRRFRYFYALPWTQRATKDEARKLGLRLREALQDRKSRFPDLADEIEHR